MLEFPGGNEIVHLLGVFMNQKFFKFLFRSLGIRFNISKTGKGCYKFYGVLQFRYLLGKKIAAEGYSNGHAGNYYVITHLLNYR